MHALLWPCSGYMFCKAVYGIDMQSQGDLLREVAELVDAGAIKTTMHTKYSWTNYAKAFDTLESSSAIGKIVLTIDENAV